MSTTVLPHSTEPRHEGAPPRTEDAAGWDERFAGAGPEELLRWAIGRWRDRIAIGTSFQAEGMVLLDMAWRIDPKIRVFTLDTGRLPEETYELIERVRERYGLRVELITPDPQAVAELVRRDGPNLFYRSLAARRACCRVRKVEPLGRALRGLDAWITGLRRDQAASRRETPRVAVDAEHSGIVKLSPLADWRWDDVWAYVRVHEVPYHALYDQGYTSIGCAPCTRPVKPWEDHRAGRWWWESPGSHKECGLHMPPPLESGQNGSKTHLPVVPA